MWPFKQKIKEKRKIVFDNDEIVFDYPEKIRIPNVGEHIWFSVFNQGNVIKITNQLIDDCFITTIYINDFE